MKARILIIEGAEDVRESAQSALETGGEIEVITAGIGRQGVHMAERQQPDAILIDMVMPDIDGPRILLELRANPSTRDIPVIFLTAEGGAAAPTGAGVQGAIRKPLDPDGLRDQVRALLGW